jgi:putative transposase
MIDENYYSIFEEIIEDISGGGKDSLTKSITAILNLAMLIEQEKAIGAGHYERNDQRSGLRIGLKPKTLMTRVGEIPVVIPQVRGMHFYPGSILKGDRGERALKLAIFQMYIQGVSTRKEMEVPQNRRHLLN